MELATTGVVPAREEFGYSSADSMMANGPDALYEHIATKIEPALGRSMPQMDVRFKNLSLTADIVVADGGSKFELPTLPNTLKKAFAGPKKHVVHKEILKNVSGMFRPGTMTLLLGQPGSGKSALMKVLSGRFPMSKNITFKGDVTYNSVKRQEIVKLLPQFVAYVSQRDKHFPTLTVKETLEFAHQFTGGEFSRRGKELLTNGSPEENAAALAAAKAMFDNYPDLIIRQLGLAICQNTIVGDSMLRGISGGERKRVTTGEMEFGMKYMTLMDEISTGLDSAATYDIICTQRGIAQKLRKTVVIALLQPSPEVMDLFDDVMILNEGELMYHGPVGMVESFFESLGFQRPAGRDLADYLLDLGTKEQYQYQKDLSAPGRLPPRLACDFAERFRDSVIFEEMSHALDAPHDPMLLRNVTTHMQKMPEFHQSFWASTMTLFRRQITVTYRNKPFIFGRLLMIAIMGLLYCTTFFQFDPTQVSVVMGIIFSSVMFLSMGQASQVPTYMAERDVFYKQRGANFFRTVSYVLATSISQFPLALVETIIFGSLIYWVCGFESNAGLFIIFEVILYIGNLAMGMWFLFITASCPNTNVATPVSMLTVLLFIIFAGFIVTTNEIPVYLIWVHWISPISWSVRALAINQYRASSFDVCVYDGVDYCTEYGMKMGEYYLDLFGLATDKTWIVYGIIYGLCVYVFFMFLTFLMLEYNRYESPENVDVSEQTIEDAEAYNLVETPKAGAGHASAIADGDQVVIVQPEKRNFIPVTVAFQDLWYSVSDPQNPKESLTLLKGVSGFAQAGSVTALMGSSGAGKTTLMDVIAGRKTGGKITGKILLNGYPATDLSIRRCTGYCEQMDIHSEAATIREALTFSSFLRQDSSIPDSQKYDSVEECLDLLGLRDIADQIVRGSSVEQMKRLTIGVELAAQPSVIFLDEPTSGLDARSAKLIMDGVRKVADSGRTIVCTIHQPSADVFFLFDSLLLLKRGGETVFYGDLGKDCRNMIDYFESIPGVDPLPVGYNPATWMLECIGAGVGQSAGDATDFVQVFNHSTHHDLMMSALDQDGVARPSTKYDEITFTDKRAADSKTQLRFLMQRFFRMYWRTPTYNLTRYGSSIFLAVLFGIIFVGKDYDSYSGLNSGVGMVFMASFFNAMIAYQSVLPLASVERASFYRERAAQTYNAFYYWLGAFVVEIPYVVLCSFVFMVIFYPFVGFTSVKGGVISWIAQTLLILMNTYMGQMCAYALPSEEVANIIGVLVISIFSLYLGFSPPAYAIPSGYKWLYDIAPQRFALSILVAVVFADCDELPTWNEELQQYENIGPQLGCQPMKNSPETVGHITLKEYTEQYFGYNYDNIPKDFVVVIGYNVLFLALSLAALRFINHQKR
jgi:ABC-type multidrug transport system ATPase subunit/ABC-type multidrug transport system permease subunit